MNLELTRIPKSIVKKYWPAILYQVPVDMETNVHSIAELEGTCVPI
jgi:hypothetical protein